MIVHLAVLPGFGIAVEARQRPELASLPAVMGGLPQQRGVVREANMAAQQRGIHPGMTLAQARQHCPECLFLVPDLPRYEAVWADIRAVLRRYTPLVEPIELGQAACDLTADERRWGGDWRRAASSIVASVQAATGITPCLGVAANRLLAQLASGQVGPDGIAVIAPGQEHLFLADLPLSLLPGVDARLLLTFHILGLKTAGQLAALPRAALRQRFGALGEQFHESVHGIDRRPVVSPPDRPAVAARRECEEGTPEEALALLHDVAERCAADLARGQHAGQVIELILEWEEPGDGAMGGQLEQLGEPSSRRCGPPAGGGRARGPVPTSLMSTSDTELPIPYRIHSMLPQPGNPIARPVPPAPRSLDSPPVRRSESPVSRDRPMPVTRVTAVVRTPIATAAPLFARAEQLLRQHWPRDRHIRLAALELAVSSFAPPTQLAFGQLSMLGETGMLGGIDGPRLQALLQTENVLAARYGDTSFRALARIDPASILTERRFHWRVGLPWQPAISGRPKKRRRA